MQTLKEFPNSSSEDEPILFNPSNSSNGHQSTRAAYRAALHHLPRPSEIVPDLHLGSASDAGLSVQQREIHKRRVSATSIFLQYIDKRGRQLPVPEWKRSQHGLDRYTPYMIAPKSDQSIKPYRVPSSLLSRSYRGTLLAVQKIGCKYRRKKAAKPIPEDTSNVPSSSDESDSLVDFEYWISSSESESDKVPSTAQVQYDKNKVQKACSDAGPQNGGLAADFSKKDFIKKVLEDTDSDISSSSHSSAKRSPSPTPIIERPPSPVKEDAFQLLLNMVGDDPDCLFRPQPPMKSEQNSEDVPSVVPGSSSKVEPELVDLVGKEDEKLSPFEKEMSLGMKYCQSSLKGRRSYSHLDFLQHMQSKRTRLGVNGIEECKTPETSSQRPRNTKVDHMMKRMGFTGRLGAKEDGRREVLQASKIQGRSGLGSRLNRNAVIEIDVGLHPDSLKDKELPSGEKDESHSIHANGADKSSNANAREHPVEKKSKRKRETLTALKKVAKRRLSTQLDEDDELETDAEDDRTDNGRRAVLIDFDMLILNSHGRRISAFKKMVESNDKLKEVDVCLLLGKNGRDFCDADLVDKAMKDSGLKDNLVRNKLLCSLNEAFEALSTPEVNREVLAALDQYSRDVYFGIFSMGSEARLYRELKATGLSNRFLQEVCLPVKSGIQWPYLETWQDLLLRVGVTASQCAFLLSNTGRYDAPGGAVVGSILGAQTIVSSLVGKEVHVRVNEPQEKEEVVTVGPSSPYEDWAVIFGKSFKRRMPPVKRRRVMTLYAADGLWYSSCVAFEQEKKEEGKKCILVEFYKYGTREWVASDDIVPLVRRDYRRMRDAGFPGVLEPFDAEFI